MLNKLRNFSKGKLAVVLVAIIIIPFVFWGMGSVFQGGNTNSVAKINSHNISTQNFVDHINQSGLDNNVIKENISNNILEDLLRGLVSKSLIEIEIKSLNFIINDETLAKKIKKNKIFHDKNNQFSRIKYEKFLLENNLNARAFEERFRQTELNNKFFFYISGGVKSPYFISNKIYKDKRKKIEIEYFDLNNIYKKKDEFSDSEISKFINENVDKLKNVLIDFSYIKITPKNLIQVNEFNNEFFSKIDQIENDILNGSNIEQINNKFGLKLNKVKNFSNDDKKNPIFNEIYQNKNKENIKIVDKNDFYLLYEINDIKKVLPNTNDIKFINLVKNTLYEENKYEFNKDLLIKIQNKEFKNIDFLNMTNENNLIKKVKINSIKDNNLFSESSIKLLYSLPKDNFLLMNDDKNNIYLAKINNTIEENLSNNSEELLNFSKEANTQVKDNIYKSYNYLINTKYKIKINQKTLERLKNYFK